MEFDSVVKKRKSIRDFSKKKATWKRVLDAVDAANQGPFAGNHNNLKFMVVEDFGTIKDIAGFAGQSWIANAGILVLVLSDDSHLESLYGERGRVYSRQQAGAAIQTMLLKFAEMGLASCWVGAYTDELLKQKLGIPQNIQVEAILPVGYEDKVPGGEKKKKKDLENVLFWEKWGERKRPTGFKEDESGYSPDMKK